MNQLHPLFANILAAHGMPQQQHRAGCGRRRMFFEQQRRAVLPLSIPVAEVREVEFSELTRSELDGFFGSFLEATEHGELTQ